MYSERVATAIRLAVKHGGNRSYGREVDADAQEEKNVLVKKCGAAFISTKSIRFTRTIQSYHNSLRNTTLGKSKEVRKNEKDYLDSLGCTDSFTDLCHCDCRWVRECWLHC